MKKHLELIFVCIMLCMTAQALAAPAPPVMSYETNGLNISISWSQVSDATSYTLYYAPYPYTGPETIGSLAMGDATSYSIDLWDNAAYYIAVTAHNDQGDSGYSNIESFTVPYPSDDSPVSSGSLNLTGTLSSDYPVALGDSSLLDKIVSIFIPRAFASAVVIKEVRAIPITVISGLLSKNIVREMVLGTIVSPISEDGSFDIDLPKGENGSLQKWLLVLIDENGHVAGFINIQEDENKLYSLPTSEYSGDQIELGSVYKEGDDAVSLEFNIRNFSESHIYTEEQLLQLANVNQAYKSIAYMLEKCDTTNLDNISCFEYNLYFDFSGDFVDIINAYGYAETLEGYSVHVGAKGNNRFADDFLGVAEGFVVYEMYPANGQVFTNQGVEYSFDNPISTEAETKTPTSSSDGGLYFWDNDHDTYVNNGGGNGLGISFATVNTFPIPQHWSLDRNGFAYENFKLSHVLPVDQSGEPQILYPSVKMELEPSQSSIKRVSSIDVEWYQKIGNVFVPADKAISRELIKEYNVTLYDPDGVTGNTASHAVNFINKIDVGTIDVSHEDLFHNNTNEDNYTVHSVTVGYWFSGNYYAFLWYNKELL